MERAFPWVPFEERGLVTQLTLESCALPSSPGWEAKEPERTTTCRRKSGNGTSRAVGSSPPSTVRSRVRRTTGLARRQASVAALFAGDAERPEGRDHARGAAREGPEGAEYDAWPIRIGEGDQFGSGFVEINPNSKIPALVDRSGAEPVRVFESGAILVYLAEKFGEFLPASARSAPRPCPGCSGRWAARRSSAAASATSSPTRREDRICDQSLCDGGQAPARRLNRRLAENEYVAGQDYSIADIAIWPWYGGSRSAAATKAPTYSSPRTDMSM